MWRYQLHSDREISVPINHQSAHNIRFSPVCVYLWRGVASGRFPVNTDLFDNSSDFILCDLGKTGGEWWFSLGVLGYKVMLGAEVNEFSCINLTTPKQEKVQLWDMWEGFYGISWWWLLILLKSFSQQVLTWTSGPTRQDLLPQCKTEAWITTHTKLSKKLFSATSIKYHSIFQWKHQLCFT